MRALLVASALLLAGCASEPAGAVVVPLEERDAERFRACRAVDVAPDVPSPDAARAVAAAVRILGERGYETAAVVAPPSLLVRPVVLVDAARVRASGGGGLAGRVAVFVPGERGPVFSRVFYVEDEKSLDDALEAILGKLPRRPP